MHTHPLRDRFGRTIDYLRISVTDRCDLRCQYCMAESMQFLPHSRLLSLQEIFFIARNYVELGVRRIRITGGEPLVRHNVIGLFEQLGSLRQLQDLTLTTNGTQLVRFAPALKDSGVTRVNISLDTLDPDRFSRITRVGKLDKTLAGIDAALAQGFDRIKINSVIMRRRNEDEVPALLRFAIERGIDISFIENMPLGDNGEHNHRDAYYSSDQIQHDLAREYTLIPSAIRTAGPARYFRIAQHPEIRVGFISPHSHNFCASCNRVRLTAEGQLLLCLGQEHSADLKQVVRQHPGDDAALQQAIIDSLEIKPEGHDFDIRSNEVLLRHMNLTGG